MSATIKCLEPNTHNTLKVQNDVASPPQYSDEALALRFADEHAHDARYVALWGQWMHYDGRQWKPDVSLIAVRNARDVCRTASAETGNLPIASRLASAGTIYAVEKLARADKRLAANVDMWDADPWQLNTPDHVVDLRTGKKRPHDPFDYHTRMTAVSPHNGCPLWMSFLDRIFAANNDMIGYLQRLAGYALTGRTAEHVMGFCHGSGANGKSTLLNTLSGILGNYSAVAPMDALTASAIDRHPTEIAMLRGARLVTANETEEGRRWAEARIKALTGGDPITARQLYCDTFTFIPQFKLVVAGNHKPGLTGVDEAIRRRIHLVPFTVTIPTEERDPALCEKLKAEWPGILAWAIEGCLNWQTVGLKPPPAVVEATERYLESEDAISLWIEERCEKSKTEWESSSALYASWKHWAECAGEYASSQKRFIQVLESKGLMSVRKAKGRGILGLRLRHDVPVTHASMTLVTGKNKTSKK